MYKPDQYKIKQLPTPGTKQLGVVLNIEDGQLRDYLSEQQINEKEPAELAKQVINVQIEVSGDTCRKILTLPPDNEPHPSSNMAKWKMVYGDFPTVGQKVYCLVDQHNRWKVDL